MTAENRIAWTGPQPPGVSEQDAHYLRLVGLPASVGMTTAVDPAVNAPSLDNQPVIAHVEGAPIFVAADGHVYFQALYTDEVYFVNSSIESFGDCLDLYLKTRSDEMSEDDRVHLAESIAEQIEGRDPVGARGMFWQETIEEMLHGTI